MSIQWGNEEHQEHLLVALEVAIDLVLHAQWDTIKLPCHFRRVAALVQRGCESSRMLCKTPLSLAFSPASNIPPQFYFIFLFAAPKRSML